MTSALWSQLHDLFDTDDGSLPEIRVDYPNSDASASGYALLRSGAGAVVTENPCFWSKTLEAEQPIDSVPNPASLVVSGEAEPFHVVFGGLRYCDVVIPDLGVFVFQNQLALDYRMGPEWGPGQLQALFELLAELAACSPEASLSLEEDILDEVVARFQNAWRRWAAEHAA